MKNYVSLLRGINVGGHNKIKMLDLQELFQSLGYTGVKTYIQSGNVIFQSKIKNSQELEQEIHLKIKKIKGYDVKILVKTKEEWGNIVLNNPFININEYQPVDASKLHVTLLSGIPNNEKINYINSLEKKNDEQLIFIDDCVYLFYPNGYGKTKFHNTFLEKKLEVSATTRNWKTTMKINEMLLKNED